jgi:hypothetical protein
MELITICRDMEILISKESNCLAVLLNDTLYLNLENGILTVT